MTPTALLLSAGTNAVVGFPLLAVSRLSFRGQGACPTAHHGSETQAAMSLVARTMFSALALITGVAAVLALGSSMGMLTSAAMIGLGAVSIAKISGIAIGIITALACTAYVVRL